MQAVAEILKHLADAPKSISLKPLQPAPLTLIHKSNKPEPLPYKWGQRVFKRFHNIYFHLWTSIHGEPHEWDACIIEWINGLAGLSAEQIDHGLNVCRHTHPMPPTLPTFYQLCLQHQPETENALHDGSDPREKLEKQKIHELTKICIATQQGWGFRHLTPRETYAAFQFGNLQYSEIKTEIEDFLHRHYCPPLNDNLGVLI